MTVLRSYLLLAVLMAVSATSPAHAQSLGSMPAYIDIPAIGTHAPVVPLGHDDYGAMLSPTDPDTVGWFDLGMGVGAAGNALLDGHVDWGGRLRVFGLLRQLEPGDAIHITDMAGNVLTYRVSWIKLYDANNAPLDQIFEQTADEVVTLITCGGTFDQSAHMYVSRWVVRAARIEPSAD